LTSLETSDADATTSDPAATELAAVRPPEERGHTDIADRVVEKIAARAASEVEGSTGVPSSRLRFWDSSHEQSARARVDKEGVDLALEFGIRYPLPVATTARKIRRAVIARVEELSGRKVRSVSVRIPALSTIGDVAPDQVT
jgi:uncharacterized alkaline shock family protein YloU